MTSFNSKSLFLASLMGLLLLYLVGTSEAQSNQDCFIKGYTEQLSSEFCDISAIIFQTKNGRKACANPQDRWVKQHLLWLSKKLKKMAA
uniref:Chemokine interleukin-8-like domain-containing protein n=1 Tax=Sphenodon punctatus TaxID=8508 RepID=A0A8D0GEX3_SPHPU